MANDALSPWAFTDPRRSHSAIPYTDADTIALVDQAIESLVLMRSPMELGDAGTTISALVSLIVEADSRLPDAVADARDQGHTWDDIANRLATATTTARRRYATHARRRTPLDLD
ncbi:MAG: hypothetical protein ACRDYV_01245 [Acidimicrobiia bacterium]